MPDGAASSYNAQASDTFGGAPDDITPSYGARARVPYEVNSTIEYFGIEVQDDDLDLDMFSDSVEESDLKEG